MSYKEVVYNFYYVKPLIYLANRTQRLFNLVGPSSTLAYNAGSEYRVKNWLVVMGYQQGMQEAHHVDAQLVSMTNNIGGSGVHGQASSHTACRTLRHILEHDRGTHSSFTARQRCDCAADHFRHISLRQPLQ